MREEAVSADDTHVPMVVLLPPGGKRAAMPTLLQGYGSYGQLVLSPWYSPYGCRSRALGRSSLPNARRRRARPWLAVGGRAVRKPKRRPTSSPVPRD